MKIEEYRMRVAEKAREKWGSFDGATVGCEACATAIRAAAGKP